MQKSLIASLILFGAGPALAGSFEAEDVGVTDIGSIITIGCPECAAQRDKEARAAKMLPPGTEIREIREVDGKKLLYTTDNWLGGNPVTIVRKAHETDIAKYQPEDAAVPENAVAENTTSDGADIENATPATANALGESDAPGVDAEARTAALPETPKELDTSGFELRLR